MSNQYDRIEKEDSNYLGALGLLTLQKDSELGIMRIYKKMENSFGGIQQDSPNGRAGRQLPIGIRETWRCLVERLGG